MSPEKTLGTTAARLLATLSERGKRIFTTQEAAVVLDSKPEQVWKLLHDLVNRKWLKRLEGGKYMIVPLESGLTGSYAEHEFLIASNLVRPYYISYWTALNYFGYTEQVPRTIFIATNKLKRSVQISGLTYKFVWLAQRKFTGFVHERIDGESINIASREKLIVDCLDLPQYCGGIVEAAKGIWNAYQEDVLDLDKLTEIAERMGNKTIFKRLGYLFEILSLPAGEHIELWHAKISQGYSKLDPTLNKIGPHNRKWKLILNRDRQELIGWRQH